MEALPDENPNRGATMGAGERHSRTRARQAALHQRIKAARNDETPEGSDLICECSDSRCNATLQITPAERTIRRERPTLFWVRPTHVLVRLEQVIEENDRYAIVRADATPLYVVA
jgi:hypothetical protein